MNKIITDIKYSYLKFYIKTNIVNYNKNKQEKNISYHWMFIYILIMKILF